VLVNTAREVPYWFRAAKGRQDIEKEQIEKKARERALPGNPKSAGAEFQNVTD
jgi:hypothetical protein